ncbi:DUF6705 family protein [uncultured Christiangramia sp.]|uniref:DUF6705 family protein n=1 Tax=uncultured Christiangramia sp. TaxID=503836 RepID=UPI002633C2A9|nr:DUF6705 family protein [uncultured Christiangramia sp.]
MKKIILLIVLSVISLNIEAQEVITMQKGQSLGEIKKGAYYKFPTDKYQPFLGKWESQNEKYILNLEMKKLFQKGPDIYTDRMVGKLCSTVFACEDNFWELKASEVSSRDPNISIFLIFDSNGNSTGILIFELSEDGNSAKWQVKKKEGVKLKPDYLDPDLPENLSMKKLE